MDGYEFPQVSADEAGFEALMVLREGRRNGVYLDSRGKLSVGIGHLIVPTDNLALGDVIGDDRVDTLFRVDGSAAWTSAVSEAALANITSLAFLPFLASVNFQLGVRWTASWPHTWRMICNGDYNEAANALDGTPWQKETPVRVQDFQEALRALVAST
jgi:GH24 family phage-related lysozyme (muramidase)